MSIEDNLQQLSNINTINPLTPFSRPHILAPPILNFPPTTHDPIDSLLNISQSSQSSENMNPVPTFDVKNLSIIPDYEGNPNELYNFIHVTTLLLNHFWNHADIDCFQNHIITQGIQSKLKGKAKEVTSIYGCTDWPSIKDTLIQNFADQRNENSLTRDLVNLRQSISESPQRFYQKIMGLLNTISNYIELHNDNAAIKQSKKTFFQQQALTTFLAGLREPLGSTIRAMRPTDLTAAMQFIQEEDNIRYLQKNLGLPQQPNMRPVAHPAPRTTASPWQPIGTTRPQFPTQPAFKQPPQPMFRQPTAPTFRPTPQPVIRPQTQPMFGQQNYGHQQSYNRTSPFLQPSFDQSFNGPAQPWNNTPLSKPTPMETSTIVSRQPKMRVPQQQTPKYMIEEVFNIDQEPMPYSYEQNYYPEDDSYTYGYLETQKNHSEDLQYEEVTDRNFQETERTNEET